MARSGTRALTLLATPLNGIVLRTLEDGPKRLVDLRRACGSPAQTTLRAHLKELEAMKAIVRRRSPSFPGVLECELTNPGRELLFLAATLEQWLRHSPEGPIAFGSGEAKAAIKALAEGWSTSMLRALAAGPMTLTQLDGVIDCLSYPSLERRLMAMRLAGLIEARPSNGRGTPYAVTDWLRRGAAPLAAAARWERRHLPEKTAPLRPLDTEATFLLAVPLLRLPDDVSGSCRMAAEFSNGRGRSMAGVVIEGQEGRISSCTTRLQGCPDAWTLGNPIAWLAAVIEGDADRLELGGDRWLARNLIDGLHSALFAQPLAAGPKVGTT